MIKPFTYTGLTAKVVFGFGMLALVAEEIRALGCRRALVISLPRQCFSLPHAETHAVLLLYSVPCNLQQYRRRWGGLLKPWRRRRCQGLMDLERKLNTP